MPLPAFESAAGRDPADRDQVSDQVTGLLLAWTGGESAALEDLIQVVYRELRALAGSMFRAESKEHTLQPTALVHEAFLRLVNQNRIEWKSRAQFFAVAGCLMRRILVDHARARVSGKRGGGAIRVTLPDSPAEADLEPEQLLELGDALEELAALDEQQARVVDARYFAGMTIEETAAALDISPATVKREWTAARAWLLGKLSPS